jgi:hypothetical protein
MPEELICPNCQRLIPLEDINVSTDIALCRGCGRTFSFSMIRESGALLEQPLNLPPRHVRIEEHYPGQKTIRYKKISPVVLFLIPFTAVWSGFSMWGLYIQPLMQDPIDWGRMLFGIPFLLGTIVLVSVILFCLFGKWVITLDNGTGTVFVGLGSIGYTRSFHYGRDTLVSLKNSGISQNEVPLKGICIRNELDEFVFGSSIQEKSKLYIAALITEEAANG